MRKKNRSFLLASTGIDPNLLMIVAGVAVVLVMLF